LSIIPSVNSPDIPTLTQARRILCIQPHYDDNDLGAGGTLAALAASGAEIIYLTVTDDLVGLVDPHISNERATAQLRGEQLAAGKIIGVKEHIWLGYPDAGSYDYLELRRQIVRYIRLLSPDYLFTCDPWLPYEAHRDHIQTGLAVAEASFLQSMVRLPSDPEIDSQYTPYTITGLAFYFTHAPNTTFDISGVQPSKHQAIRQYQAQFAAVEMERLQQAIVAEEQRAGVQAGFAYGEQLKILRPSQLHLDVHAWRS
jgi:LmbE family N-acetylglucosaminyl deacetylase